MSENGGHVSTRPLPAPMSARRGKPPAGGVGSVRIIAGQWRGTRLPVPDRPGLRPTSDRVREAIFNILAHGVAGFSIEGARVLDLFAGTGAGGIEALSRGASAAIFVEHEGPNCQLIGANLRRAKLDGGRVVRAGHHAAGAAAVFFRGHHSAGRWQHAGRVAVSVRQSHRDALCPLRE